VSRKNQKKKTFPIFLLSAFVIIVIGIILYTHRSQKIAELDAPDTGVSTLLSYGNRLIAAGKNNQIKIWHWNDLSKKPDTINAEAEKLTVIRDDRILWVPSDKTGIISISDLKQKSILKSFQVEPDKNCKLLKTSPDGNLAAALVVNNNENRIEINIIKPEVNAIYSSVDITMEKDFILKDIAVSSQADNVAVAGANEKAWIIAAELDSARTLFKRKISDCGGLTRAVFSPDGNTIYAGGFGKFAYAFGVTNGEIVKKFQMPGKKPASAREPRVSCIALSSDGKLLAIGREPSSNVWIWDLSTGKKIGNIQTGQYTVIGLAFSPEGSMIASADFISRTPIKIWKTPPAK